MSSPLSSLSADLRRCVVPVIDLKGGRVVHAIAGDRESYRPLKSRFVSGEVTAIALVDAFQKHGFDTIYIADLDAIERQGSHEAQIQQAGASGCRIWLDSGFSTVKSILENCEQGIDRLVVGLESIRSRSQINEILGVIDPERLIISIDMKRGRLVTQDPTWVDESPEYVANGLIEMGIRNLLLLDLGRVGTGTGIGTESLCKNIVLRHPSVFVSVGGGVASVDDIGRCLDAGAQRVLIASALHDGRIGVA